MNDKIAEYIESLAQQLGVAVTHVYEVMARQMVAEGITYGLMCLAFIILIPIAAYKLAKATRRNWDELCRDGWDSEVSVGWMIGGLVAAVVMVACLFSLPDYVMHVVNPEYYIVKEILDALK